MIMPALSSCTLSSLQRRRSSAQAPPFGVPQGGAWFLTLRREGLPTMRVFQRSAVLVLLLLLASPAVAGEPQPGQRTALDESIDRALVFPQRMQEADGSWKAAHTGKNPA